MKLIPDWRRVLGRAWSMWAMYLAALCSGLEALCYIFPDVLGRYLGGWALGATFLICCFAPFLRIKAQKGFEDGRS